MIRLPSLFNLQTQLLATAKRFPLPVLAAVVLTGFGIYAVHEGHRFDGHTWLWQTLMTASLSVLFLTALTLAVETLNKTKRGLILLGGAGLMGLYYCSLPTDPDTSGSLWIVRHLFLCLGSLVAFAWTPYWQQPVSNGVLWRWDTDVLAKILVTIFFAIVLFAGSAAALWSVNALFGLDVDEKLYFDLWILSAALFGPLFFLSQVEKDPSKLKEPKTVERFLAIFTKYIMTPIALVYLLILYAYTAKILITWEWPKNVLGWLVICFLGVAIFTYFLWTPLLKKAKSTPSKLPLKGGELKRIFWLILLPQIALLFVAIGWRIHAYSWTENRYFVVILGLWLLGTTVYFLLKKEARFKWAFVALTALIFTSQIGPLSGYQVGQRAQTARLTTVLTELKILQNGRIVPAQADVNDERENEVASILDYLHERHGQAPLQKLFPQPLADLASHNRYDTTRQLMQAFGLDYRSQWERRSNAPKNQHFNYAINYQSPRNIEGYQWHTKLNYHKGPSRNESVDFPYSFEKASSQQPAALLVKRDNQLLETIDLESTFQALLADATIKPQHNLDPEQLVMWHESDLLAAKIYFTNLWGKAGKVESYESEIYVRIKE